ncbi:BA75_00496T0 [Komagataella pastoris]|uniref:BA75_00496T0 n=1 Tax=Komagataella pastoris TaxID=4922 RepID=A0A1B2J9C1_PICPA|nr:BA75_00496T0 [Komagataella pastoris]
MLLQSFKALRARSCLVSTSITQTAGYKTQYLGQKVVKVYQPLPKLREGTPLMKYVKENQYKKLDPNGVKKNLLDKSNPNLLRSGDIVRITYNNKQPPLVGMVIAVKRNGCDSNILLRNSYAKLGVEIRVPIFNPVIERVDILKRPTKYRSRNKLYYIRGTKLDVTDIESSLKKQQRRSN